MLRRFLLASVAGLSATAALPNIPDAAAADPSAFVDDLDAQLQHLIETHLRTNDLCVSDSFSARILTSPA